MYERFQHKYNQTNALEPTDHTDMSRLSDGKCPLCGLDLIQGERYSTCTCGFKIHSDRLAQIQQEQQDRRMSAKERKVLREGKKIKFKGTKVFHGEKPERLDLGF